MAKIVQSDWLAVFESFAMNRAAFYLVQVSVTSFLSICHPLWFLMTVSNNYINQVASTIDTVSRS